MKEKRPTEREGFQLIYSTGSCLYILLSPNVWKLFFFPVLHTADSNYTELLYRRKLPQMSLCALNPLFLDIKSKLFEHIFIFCLEWEVRLNPRRMVVARIDMSGSINHQMLLKDARADALRGGGLFVKQVGVSKNKKKKKSILSSLSCVQLSSDRMHSWPCSRSFSQDRGQQFHQQRDVVRRCSVEAWGRKRRRSTQRRKTFRGDFLSPESRTHLLHWYQCSHSYCVWAAFVIRYVLYMRVFLLSELVFFCFLLERGRNRARCVRLMWPLFFFSISSCSSLNPPRPSLLQQTGHLFSRSYFHPSIHPPSRLTDAQEGMRLSRWRVIVLLSVAIRNGWRTDSEDSMSLQLILMCADRGQGLPVDNFILTYGDWFSSCSSHSLMV